MKPAFVKSLSFLVLVALITVSLVQLDYVNVNDFKVVNFQGLISPPPMASSASCYYSHLNCVETLREAKLDEAYKPIQAALRRAKKKINIVVWYPPFNMPEIWKSTDGDGCGNCELTMDKNKINDANTKAVVFHFQETKLETLPEIRNLSHYWVWWAREGPISSYYLRNKFLTNFNAVFNLTMTYRSHSDIYYPDGSAGEVHQSHKLPITEKQLDDLIKKKTDLSLFVAANCDWTKGAIARLNLVNELVRLGLQFKGGGPCFKQRGIKDYENHKYKFYLAFENSWLCKEYITEKFWDNALGNGTVPVVVGPTKADYEKIAPPNSFIYAHDYTPVELVNYLQYLDKNVTAYKEYLRWMTMPQEKMPNYRRRTRWCQLCRVLHGINVDNLYNPDYEQRYSDIPLYGETKRPRVVPSIRDMYYGNENAECLAH